MAQAPEELNNRLENISAIQPLLAALRTISLSNWRVALRKITRAGSYLSHIQSILAEISKFLPEESQKMELGGKKREILIIVGSNRGLCGDFNRNLADQLDHYKKNHETSPKIILFGERLKKIIDRKKIAFDDYISFPNTSELTPKYAKEILLKINSDNQESEKSLIFNMYRGAGKFSTIFSPIYPNSFIKVPAKGKSLEDFTFDTPPADIFAFVKNELSHLSLYYAFLLSSAAEHSTRFQLMENAATNADNLSDELFLEVQALRRQRITEEMQELAIGAGLLKKQR